MLQIKEKEGQRILAKIKDTEYVFALAIEGTNPTSEAFAKQIDQLGIQGKSQLTFVIGGSLGLSQEVMTRSDAKISFGKMTYPPTHETDLIGTNLSRIESIRGAVS